MATNNNVSPTTVLPVAPATTALPTMTAISKSFDQTLVETLMARLFIESDNRIAGAKTLDTLIAELAVAKKELEDLKKENAKLNAKIDEDELIKEKFHKRGVEHLTKCYQEDEALIVHEFGVNGVDEKISAISARRIMNQVFGHVIRVMVSVEDPPLG